MFLEEAGVKAKHIPYKGVGPMLTDLIGGQVEFGVLALPSIQAHLKSGALRAIGTSSAQRAAGGARDPHVRGAGAAELRRRRLVRRGRSQGPARGRREAHSRRRSRAHSIRPEVKEAMAKQGNTIAMTSPEEAQAFFRSELAKYAALVKKSGLEPQ